MLGCTAVPSTNPKTSQADAVTTIANTEVKSVLRTSQTLPVATNPKADTKSRIGSFISGEHATSGKAKIVQENGTYFIEFDQTFKTSENGPDLFVILHRSPDILKVSKPPDYRIAEGDYVAIAPLKSFNGKQRYEIPANIQSDGYQSVAVWCRKYNATFGFAPLSGV
ncbi:MAG: electron transfer flavoprotein [Pseudanabaena frigida]|uniref:Electron transfer flavoprotein n=1 Tax=Pseudanabaena frigida TaxID=945775 RepID=A0A2W4W477_9CYAN|nr:MAG: electron transfer flavoprotein [Pseudanabaena frigida]PZO39459.1 MAG: electron transfer flavoprotein [Pseudanabaena frigida]